MKTVMILISLSCLTGSVALSQCKTTFHHEYVMFIDQTDFEHTDMVAHYLPHDFHALKTHMHRHHAFNTCHEGTVTVYPINNLGHNRPSRIHYDAIDKDMTPAQINAKVVKPFMTGIQSSISKVLSHDQHDHEFKHTRIYEPLCKVLNEYHEHKRPVTIIMYSDLLENHEAFSMYKSKEHHADPEKTLQHLASSCHCALPDDLSFAHIQLISLRHEQNDRLISAAQHFWRNILVHRSAKVHTGPSLRLDLAVK